jgi:hypothetical protein
MIEEIQITDDDYDYSRYEQILLKLLDSMWRDDENLVRGENISDIPEVKIMFESYADKEVEDEEGNYIETIENGDTNQECYCIFIHKDSGQEDFEFPEHETAAFVFGNLIMHRPAEEVCIYAWYDVEHNDWSINSLGETSDHEMTNKEVMDILETLNTRYFGYEIKDEPQPAPSWPFPSKG